MTLIPAFAFRRLIAILFVVSLMFVFASAAFAQGDAPPDLTLEQLATIGFVATIGIQVVKIAMALLKVPKPNKLTMQIVAFVASSALAYFWHPITGLPEPQADPGAFALALVTQAAAIFGLAYIVYRALLEELLKGLDGLAARVLNRQVKLLAP